MTYAERMHQLTRSELISLRENKRRFGGMLRSVTVTINGRKYTVHNEEEADEILEAYADWFEDRRQTAAL